MLNPAKGLVLSGLGYVRVFVHRPLQGTVKRLTIKREADGGWYAVFITERDGAERRPLAEIPVDRIRGADVGLQKFATFDDSASVGYPGFLRQSEGKIKLIQHHFSRKQRVRDAATSWGGGSPGSTSTSAGRERTSRTSSSTRSSRITTSSSWRS